MYSTRDNKIRICPYWSLRLLVVLLCRIELVSFSKASMIGLLSPWCELSWLFWSRPEPESFQKTHLASRLPPCTSSTSAWSRLCLSLRCSSSILLSNNFSSSSSAFFSSNKIPTSSEVSSLYFSNNSSSSNNSSLSSSNNNNSNSKVNYNYNLGRLGLNSLMYLQPSALPSFWWYPFTLPTKGYLKWYFWCHVFQPPIRGRHLLLATLLPFRPQWYHAAPAVNFSIRGQCQISSARHPKTNALFTFRPARGSTRDPSPRARQRALEAKVGRDVAGGRQPALPEWVARLGPQSGEPFRDEAGGFLRRLWSGSSLRCRCKRQKRLLKKQEFNSKQLLKWLIKLL